MLILNKPTKDRNNRESLINMLPYIRVFHVAALGPRMHYHGPPTNAVAGLLRGHKLESTVLSHGLCKIRMTENGR